VPSGTWVLVEFKSLGVAVTKSVQVPRLVVVMLVLGHTRQVLLGPLPRVSEV
jgi:hypothetical protein